MTGPGYRGRFAPSPTGPLHLGSLVAALASYLDARQRGGKWLLRIEDIDPPREVAGAAARIRESLLRHGLHWDGEVLLQSTRFDAYRTALETLKTQALTFDCICTRAILGPGGSCGRRCTPCAGEHHAVRIQLPPRLEAFDDLICGEQKAPASLQGQAPRDIVLWRKDGLPAYALAVTVDDIAQGISHVLRGADLLGETAVQRYLITRLGAAVPSYGHLPLVRADDGRKLSKQNGAPALDDASALENLRRALSLLKQRSASAPARTPEQLLTAAIESWNPRALTAEAP